MLQDIDFRQIIIGANFWMNIINAPEYPCIPSKLGGFVYALVDPRDGHFHYIGKTDDPQTRYKSHLRDARNDLYSTAKASWINDLAHRGYRPLMIGLATLPVEQLQEAERQFIELLQTYGCPLTNVVHGGSRAHVVHRLHTEFERSGSEWALGAQEIEMYVNWLQRAGQIPKITASPYATHPELPIEIAEPCYVWGDCPNCNPGVREKLNRQFQESIQSKEGV
jgi:hypothetical protein